jgi:hypothetical protein
MFIDFEYGAGSPIVLERYPGGHTRDLNASSEVVHCIPPLSEASGLDKHGNNQAWYHELQVQFLNLNIVRKTGHSNNMEP